MKTATLSQTSQLISETRDQTSLVNNLKQAAPFLPAESVPQGHSKAIAAGALL